MLLYRISLPARDYDYTHTPPFPRAGSELDVTPTEVAKYKFFTALDECIDEAKVVLSIIAGQRSKRIDKSLCHYSESLCHYSEIRKYSEAHEHLARWIDSDEIRSDAIRMQVQDKFTIYREYRLVKDHDEFHMYGIDYKVEKSINQEDMRNAMIEDSQRNQANSLAGLSAETDADPEPALDKALRESDSKHYIVRAMVPMEIRYAVYENRRKEIVIEGKVLRGDLEKVEVFASDWRKKCEWKNIKAEYTDKRHFDKSISVKVIECAVEIPGITEPIYLQMAGRAIRDPRKTKYIQPGILDFPSKDTNEL